MKTLTEILKEFDEKFKNLKVVLVEPDEHPITNDIKSFLSQSIKTALESVRNIELAPDEKTIKDLKKLENKSQSFGYGQGFVCNQLDKNIKDYLKN